MNLYQLDVEYQVLENNITNLQPKRLLVVANSMENAIWMCKRQYQRGLRVLKVSLEYEEIPVQETLTRLSDVEPEGE